MKIELIKIDGENCFNSSELQTRVLESTKSLKTTHYRALADNVEVAFVSLDRWPEPEIDQMVVYEIFISRDKRGQGIGSAILSEIEKVALQEGFRKIHLRPSSLDQDTIQAKLNDWYQKNGYEWALDISGDMEKLLK